MPKKKKPTEDIFAEMEDEQKKSVTEADLATLSDLAKQQKTLEEEADESQARKIYDMLVKRGISLATIDQARSLLNTDYQNIRNNQLPEKMEELGFASFELKDGGSIRVKEGISVSVLDKPKLINTIIQRGYQDAVKNQVVVKFPMEGRKSARNFVKYVTRYYKDRDKCEMVESEDIHSATLKKLMKTFKEEGKSYPDSVSVFEYKFTKIT